jgi:hypothetical protein
MYPSLFLLRDRPGCVRGLLYPVARNGMVRRRSGGKLLGRHLWAIDEEDIIGGRVIVTCYR